MKKVDYSEEIIYVTPQVSIMNLTVDHPFLGSSNEGIGDDDDI